MLVETSRRGPVMTITLADTERRNALSGDLVAELMAACDAADADPDVRVVVVTNRGNTFCAGANLRERTDGAPAAVTAPDRLFGRYATSPKPYVGRIDGHCVAGGMGLAAALDITVASEKATFGFSEVRLGVAPAVISVVSLPKMRPVDARSAFLRGQRFSADDAVMMGLITEAAPAEDLDSRVEAVVSDLLAAAPAAVAASKQLLNQVPRLSTSDAFAWTADLSAELFGSPDGQEGMAAFLERRPPSWHESWPTS